MRNKRLWTIAVLVVTMLAASVLPAFAEGLPADFPYPVKEYQTKTLLAGFDPAEFGGDDSNCTRSELMLTQWGEVASSQEEQCKVVLEWSVKIGAKTIFAGVYSLEPNKEGGSEWFYTPKRAEGDLSDPRFVGTLHYLPRGWNAHQYAVNIATARDTRDGTLSVVGLSPTDPWVLNLAKTAIAGSTSAVTTSEPARSCVVTTTPNFNAVNVRIGPGLNKRIDRTEAVGNVLNYIADDGNWKELSDGLYIKSNLCREVSQADG